MLYCARDRKRHPGAQVRYTKIIVNHYEILKCNEKVRYLKADLMK